MSAITYDNASRRDAMPPAGAVASRLKKAAHEAAKAVLVLGVFTAIVAGIIAVRLAMWWPAIGH